MRFVYIDTEGCGLYGFTVLIQYAWDDGEIQLYEIWRNPVAETLELIESFFQPDVCIVCFNTAFDLFHFNKIYNCFRLLKNKDEAPDVQDVVDVEMAARDGVCLKPYHTFDVFLHARKGPYQSTMDRSDIRIGRVPSVMSRELAKELGRRVPLNDIYFASFKTERPEQWKVLPSRDYETHEVLPGFDDVILEFAPSSGLKALAVDALQIPKSEIVTFTDVEVDKRFRPIEYGFAPFAKAVKEWGAWPDVIEHHIRHWGFNQEARKYAAKDVDYLRRLYDFFNRPAVDDDDSVLAAKVAAVRWKGFAVNIEEMKALKEKTKQIVKIAPRAASYVMPWLKAVMDDTEKAMVHTTNKNTLEEIANWTVLKEDYVCDKPEWHTIDNLGTSCIEHGAPTTEHPAAKRAKLVIQARSAEKEIELYDKILLAGRFHPSFKVIGTLSGRMSGTDGLNPQAIKRIDYVRRAFTLKFDGEFLTGGDGKSFEVVLAAAEYNDPELTKDLKSGKKIHGIMGTFLFPEETYEEILASEHTAEDHYTKSKSGFFALVYAGDERTLNKKQGIPLEVGKKALDMFVEKYKQVAVARQKVFASFCTMIQPIPHGPVIWQNPADYVESMFGFRRYFTLENKICKALYDLAQNPPDEWKEYKGKVQRRDRLQTHSGAVQSALYGAAFGIQGSVMRAAANHKIQSSGAQVTKRVEANIWTLQPCGICEWLVRNFQVHDEVQVVTSTASLQQEARDKMQESVDSFKDKVPLLAFSWHQNMNTWADK